MKRKLPYLLIGQSALLFLPCSYALPVQNPCNDISNKDAVHCAYIAPAAQSIPGKFIKIKEVQNGRPATTKIFCVAPSSLPLKTIPQTLWSDRQPSNQMSWQFSQCLDEDCTTSKSLSDDKFTVTKSAKLYSSGPKNSIEINLDPNYGVNCKAEGSKQLASISALEMRIADAIAMIQAVPVALDATSDVLTQMTAIANDAASGTYTPPQLLGLDNQFQTLKDEMDKVQRVNTLDGYKKISAGSINITFGYVAYDYLQIPIPASDQYSLGVSYLDVLTQSDAEYALLQLANAQAVIANGLSLKK